MIELEGPRLRLREWTLADAPSMYAYAKDERVGPRAGWPPHTSIEQSRQIIEMFRCDQDVWAIELRESGEVIGSIGLHERKHVIGTETMVRSEIGYVLSPEHWGLGYMSEAVKLVLRHAFDDIGLHEVWCSHFEGNVRSKQVIERSGFRYQGTNLKTLPRLDHIEVTEFMYVLSKEAYRRQFLKEV